MSATDTIAAEGHLIDSGLLDGVTGSQDEPDPDEDRALAPVAP